MSYANAIRDIAPGSIWRGINGCVVTVLQAAAAHVLIRRAILTETMHEREFRDLFLPLYDREKIRSQFTMSLANLGEFRAFWLPDMAKITVRSVSCQRQFRVPEGALLVGTWSAPCRVEDFFEALDAVILAPETAKRKARAGR